MISSATSSDSVRFSLRIGMPAPFRFETMESALCKIALRGLRISWEVMSMKFSVCRLFSKASSSLWDIKLSLNFRCDMSVSQPCTVVAFPSEEMSGKAFASNQHSPVICRPVTLSTDTHGRFSRYLQHEEE